jgi:hypothetical protein
MLVVFAAGMAIAGPAWAGEPTGEFAVFKACPRFDSEVKLCFHAETVAGEVKLGRQTIVIERPIAIQGGIIRNELTEVETFVGAANGETVSRAPQRVPGGLFGQPLSATIELAAPASEIGFSGSNLINEELVGVSLPARVHLESPVLGGGCYIGSRTQPLMLNLTTGWTSPLPPNVPIEGRYDEVYEQKPHSTEITGTRLVDNTFAVPGATGCGDSSASSLLDSAIDSDLGLPSKDGYNTAIEQDTINQALRSNVVKSEE